MKGFLKYNSNVKKKENCKISNKKFFFKTKEKKVIQTV